MNRVPGVPVPAGGGPAVVERVQGRDGELVLRRDGEHFEIFSNGVALIDTRSGASERLLVSATAAAAADPRRILVGGLGVGFSLDEALAVPGVERVAVVEIEPAVVRWARRYYPQRCGDGLSDPRVRVVEADLLSWLPTATGPFDVICLDVDNGPSWTVSAANRGLYAPARLAELRGLLAPGGALGVWSAQEEPGFVPVLADGVGPVRTHRVEVRRGGPDVVYVATRVT
jgi:spermidine synthase